MGCGKRIGTAFGVCEFPMNPRTHYVHKNTTACGWFEKKPRKD